MRYLISAGVILVLAIGSLATAEPLGAQCWGCEDDDCVTVEWGGTEGCGAGWICDPELGCGFYCYPKGDLCGPSAIVMTGQIVPAEPTEALNWRLWRSEAGFHGPDSFEVYERCAYQEDTLLAMSSRAAAAHVAPARPTFDALALR